MDGMVTGAVINTLLSVMSGMVLVGVRSINANLKTMNGRLTEHIENKDLHYAAQARTDERLASLLKTVEAAHTRMDRLETKIES